MFQSNNLTQSQPEMQLEKESETLSIPVAVWEQLMNERRTLVDELDRVQLSMPNSVDSLKSSQMNMQPQTNQELNESEATEANAELSELSRQPLESTLGLLELSPQAALATFQSNPVQFVQSVIDEEAGKHLVRLKEEAELQGSLRSFRKKHPELKAFEGLILEQVAAVISEDEDGVLEPWDVLLEKGRERFEANFQEMLKNSTEQSKLNDVPPLQELAPPHLEGSSAREPKEALPSFSRQQIANMSLAEFKKNESKINQALKMKRIR